MLLEQASVQLPEEQADESPYSSEDNLLLEELTADYDEIMTALIGEKLCCIINRHDSAM